MTNLRTLLLALLLITSAAGAHALPWSRDQVREWEAIFPPTNVIVSLPGVASRRRLGQVDALLLERAARKSDLALLIVGMRTCGPCRQAWPKVIEAARARATVPFFDLANQPDAADAESVSTFVQYYLAGGMSVGVPAYVVIDRRSRPLSPVTHDLSQVLGWIDAPTSMPSVGGPLKRSEPADALMGASTRLVTVSASTIGEVLDAIGRSCGASIEASADVRKLHLDVQMTDMPADQLLNITLAAGSLDWASLPPHDGFPPVLRVWRRSK